MKAIVAIVLLFACSSISADIDRARKKELRHLLLHDCGSCHGMTLKGGLGPALTVQSLKHHTVAALESTVTYGRPGTPMPPFKGILNTQEIKWLVKLLKEQSPQ